MTEDDTLRQHRVEYWTRRLDQTVAHMQSSSHVIYVVDGVVLALVAFIVERLRPGVIGTMFLGVPLLFLALLNYYQSVLSEREHDWYVAIDERLREILDHEPPLNLPAPELGGAHGIYRRMHRLIALFLALSAVGMWGYAIVSLR